MRWACLSATLIASGIDAWPVHTDATMSRMTLSASAPAAFSPTEPRPPAVMVRRLASLSIDSFGSVFHTGLAS